MITDCENYRIAIISIFPKMFNSITSFGMCRRAIEKKKLEILVINPRDYSEKKNGRIDDKSYGGEPGMIIKYVPLERSILKANEFFKKKTRVVYLSPQGKILNQDKLKLLLEDEGLVLICGRYQGIDQRIIEDYVDEEISIGNYVLSGGELAAMVLIDGLIRNIAGVLNNSESLNQESLSIGMLNGPHYTRPRVLLNGKSIPKVVAYGNHEKIKKWRRRQQVISTAVKRYDLIKNANLSKEEKIMIKLIKNNRFRKSNEK